MSDLIWWMLDNPDQQTFNNFSQSKAYTTPRFNVDVYSRARGIEFASKEDAYNDWRVFGRRSGIEFDHGHDTLLKVIVKVKDENELIDKWVEYYRKMIGPHNIIIVDCGSTDPQFKQKLAELQKEMIVLRYEKYFLGIHFYSGNRSFYDEVAANCRYLAVLDADEFLFGLTGGLISAQSVKQVLRETSRPAVPGTWFNALPQHLTDEGQIDWQRPLIIDVSESSLAGLSSFAGKVIIRSDAVQRAENIGHNMHSLGVLQLLESKDFLNLGIIHLTCLPEEIARKRVLNHLLVRGIVPANSTDRLSLIDILAGRLVDANTDPRVKEYIRRYFDPHAILRKPARVWKTRILIDNVEERQEVAKIRSDAVYSLISSELARSEKRLIGG